MGGGTIKFRKFIGLKPKSSSANLQPQPITPDNFDGNDLNANGIYSTNNGGYHSYTPNNYGQPPGLSSISELPANDYGNGYTHHAPLQQHHQQGHGHQHRMSLPVQARPGGPNGQYPHDPNGYYQHHDRSSGNLSPQDAVHQNGGNSRDRRSASLGSRISLGNFGSSNSSLGGRSSVTTMSTLSSAATSPGPGGPTSPHNLSQQQHPHSLSPGYQPNSPRYPGQPPVQPPYPVSERGSPPPQTQNRSSNAHSQQSFANRTSTGLPILPGPHVQSSRSHPSHPFNTNQQSQSQSFTPSSQQHQSANQAPQSPSAADIRRTTKLLRRMFELRLEQWALSHSHESDQHLVHEKRVQVDAVLNDILTNVRSWGTAGTAGGANGGTGGRENWTAEEWDDICLVREVLGEMQFGLGVGGYGGGQQMGYPGGSTSMGGGGGMVDPVGGRGSTRGRW
ncbi:hypothetical protein B0T09DRAFT_394170 [Sordaria sp. MPI-SDFR-AT-0083]|nr:hypothetical protein B0T09DRAFT_394170 [Sordaria sp. MPI-SDFR-AT-0083]